MTRLQVKNGPYLTVSSSSTLHLFDASWNGQEIATLCLTNESGDILRKQLSKHMKHIRICTLSYKDFCKEVLTTKILTYDELHLVCLSQDTAEKQADLNEISNEIEPRSSTLPLSEAVFSSYVNTINKREAEVTIHTKQFGIQLHPLKLVANTSTTATDGPTYQCNCKIRITDITNNTNIETLSVVFDEQVEYGKYFEVPLVKDNRNVVLLPNKQYILNVSYDNYKHRMYFAKNCSSTYNNEHLTVTFDFTCNPHLGRSCISPFQLLIYRPINH